MRRLISIVASLALCASASAQRQVILTYDHGVDSGGAVEGDIKRSPVTPLTWDDRNGNGTWEQSSGSYNEELYTWVQRQQLSVDFQPYVLEVVRGARSSSGNSVTQMWWCHPDDVGILPRTTWTAAGYPYPWIGYYRINGRRFPAMVIYVDTDDGWLTFRSQINLSVMGGGTATGQYDETRPGWYGVCGLADQYHGYPGNLFGYLGSVPNFIGVYNEDHTEGTFLFNWPWWGAQNFAIADCNRDHRVGIQDLFEFLQCYASGESAGDVDRDGSVEVGDVFRYIEAYFDAQ